MSCVADMFHAWGISNTVGHLLSQTIKKVLRTGFFGSFAIYQPFNFIGCVVFVCIECYREEEEKEEKEEKERVGVVHAWSKIHAVFPLHSSN